MSQPKAKRPRKRKLIPLLLLGSDGEIYAACPAQMPPTRFVRDPQMIIAIRLTQREQDIALDALQIGVVEASETLVGILRLDA